VILAMLRSQCSVHCRSPQDAFVQMAITSRFVTPGNAGLARRIVVVLAVHIVVVAVVKFAVTIRQLIHANTYRASI